MARRVIIPARIQARIDEIAVRIQQEEAERLVHKQRGNLTMVWACEKAIGELDVERNRLHLVGVELGRDAEAA
jgi:hypothetical protein